MSPRDGWPNPSAGPAASGADIVLERAQVFETVAEAVAEDFQKAAKGAEISPPKLRVLR